MERIGHVPDLNHLRHVENMAACATHVKTVTAPSDAWLGTYRPPPRSRDVELRARVPSSARLVAAVLVLATLRPARRSFKSRRCPSPTATSGDSSLGEPGNGRGLHRPSRFAARSVRNPALGSAGERRTKGIFFGSPAAYSVSQNAGGGRRSRSGGIIRHGSTFGGLALVLQEVDSAQRHQRQLLSARGHRRGQPQQRGAARHAQQLPTPSRRIATPSPRSAERLIPASNCRSGRACCGPDCCNVDGVDLLYAGKPGDQSARRRARRAARALQGMGGQPELRGDLRAHDRFGMTHDVTWLDQFFDPNTRSTVSMPRVEHNIDRTDTWGLQLQYSRPLADSGWRIGGVVTSNSMSTPSFPTIRSRRSW